MSTALISALISASKPDTTSWTVLCLAVLLLACSGFVSASEIAFFSLSPADLDTIKEHLHPSDSRIERLLGKSERLLATVLIANNLVNVAIIMLLSFFLTRTIDFGGSAVLEFVCVTVILSFLLLLFGEVVPKIYSAGHPLSFCRLVAPPLSVLDALFRPLSSLLMRSQGLTGRIVSYRAESLTARELEQALELTDKEEIAAESPMLEGIIRFSGETVREIMTPRVDMVDVDVRASFDEVLSCVRESGRSRIPVFSETEDNIKGILYTKDLLPYTDRDKDFKWQSLMRPPFFVPETKMIDDLLRDFQAGKVHIAVVVDEFGGTSGIVTMEDILEEIVGEIDDEYDELRKPFVRLNHRTYLFEGKCPLVDMLRIMNLDDDLLDPVAGEADTLAGLLLEIKGDFPTLHERITCGHLTFEVMEMDERRIVSIKVIIGKEGESEGSKEKDGERGDKAKGSSDEEREG